MVDHTRRLTAINWDFPAAVSNYSVHGIHWYPASFIPQIPAYLIEMLSAPGDLVVDPFAGSGATLIEGLRLGRRVVGIDLNPIACLISKAKLLLLLARPWEAEIEAFTKLLEGDRLRYELGADDRLSREVDLGSSRDLARPWFHPLTFQQLLVISHRIETSGEPANTVYRAALSAILKRASSQVQHWGYVADNMVPRDLVYRDAFELFNRTLRDILRSRREILSLGFSQMDQVQSLESQARVIQGDILSTSLIQDGSADLVVTSPPYVGVTDYTTAQRLSMYWFGLEVPSFKEQEIGARWKRFRRGYIDEYLHDMRSAFSRVIKMLRPGGYIALVIGAPRGRNDSHAVLPALRELFTSMGLELKDEASRTPARQRVVDRSGTTNRELILVYWKKP